MNENDSTESAEEPEKEFPGTAGDARHECEFGATPHGRHITGPLDAPVACPGVDAPADDVPTYGAMFASYLVAQKDWIGPAQLPLTHHIRKLCQKLDADPDGPAALSSAYLQAISRLDRQRPGNTQPKPGDGLSPAGDQPSIFDEL